MTPEDVSQLVARFRNPADTGKLANPDKAAMDQAVRSLFDGGPDAVRALVAQLKEDNDPSDVSVRHTLHALAVHAAGQPDEAKRRDFALTLAGTLAQEPRVSVRAFVLRQLQVVAGPEVIDTLAPLLLDEALSAFATQALQAIGPAGAPAFRAALPKATGRTRLGLVQALAALGDTQAIPLLSPLLTDPDPDLHSATLWALARLGHAEASEALIKAAQEDSHHGTQAIHACLQLAEHLDQAGNKKAAASLYSALVRTQSDPGRRYVKDLAQARFAALNP